MTPRNRKVRRAQGYEIWAFFYAKQKNVTEEQMAKAQATAGLGRPLIADTKLIIS